MSENFTTFRGLLRGAICTRTQAQFANDSGLSAGHLNRLLNSETIARPSKQTLHKIAAAAKNGITYKMLKDALDSEDPDYNEETGCAEDREERLEQAKEDFSATFEEKVHEAMTRLHGLLKEQPYPCIVPDLQEHVDSFIRQINDNPNLPPISYDFSRSFDYIAGEHTYAQKWMSVMLTMADHKTTAESEMVIFYSETVSAGDRTYYTIHAMSTEVADLIDVNGMPPAAMDAHKDVNEEAAFELALAEPFYLEFRDTQRFTERYHDTTGKTPEERLLLSLFGSQIPYSETTEGFGFWLEALPPTFAEFIRNHKDAAFLHYRKEPENYEALEKALDDAIRLGDSKILADAMDGMKYTDADAISDWGWQAAIANIMYQETGFPYRYYAHTRPEDNTKGFVALSDKDCIILDMEIADELHLQREAFLMATLGYVKELGLTTFGDLLFTRVETSFVKHQTYHVRTPEQIEAARKKRQAEAQDDGFEPEYSVEFASGEKPEKTNMYYVLLKDGRHLRCLYLQSHNVWIALHKEWSSYIQAYDPRPIKPDPVPVEAGQEEDQDADQNAHSEN